MAIINRDLDTSEQREVFNATIDQASASGGSLTQAVGIMQVPYPCSLDAVRISCMGASGSAVVGLQTARFIAGSGLTLIPLLSATMAIRLFGTSGSLGFSLPASGSTLLNLQTNDWIVMHNFASGTAVNSGSQVAVVLKALADIKQPYGLTS